MEFITPKTKNEVGERGLLVAIIRSRDASSAVCGWVQGIPGWLAFAQSRQVHAMFTLILLHITTQTTAFPVNCMQCLERMRLESIGNAQRIGPWSVNRDDGKNF